MKRIWGFIKAALIMVGFFTLMVVGFFILIGHLISKGW